MRSAIRLLVLVMIGMMGVATASPDPAASWNRYLCAQRKYIDAVQAGADAGTLKKLSIEAREAYEVCRPTGNSTTGTSRENDPAVAVSAEQIPDDSAPEAPAGTTAKTPQDVQTSAERVWTALSAYLADPADPPVPAELKNEIVRITEVVYRGREADFQKELEEKFALEKPSPTVAETTRFKRVIGCLLVARVRQRLLDRVRDFGYNVDCQRVKYQAISWLNPFRKIPALFRLWRDEIIFSKGKKAFDELQTPEKRNSYVNYGKEILSELAHLVPGFLDLYKESSLHHTSVPLKPVTEGAELFVYTIPCPHGTDWSSPRSLLKSGIFNQVSIKDPKKHAIGHMFIRLRIPGRPDVITGMTTLSQTEEKDLVLKHGYCLGVLTADLVGKFDDSKKLEDELVQRFPSGLVSYVRFLLHPDTGKRLQEYFQEYSDRKCFEHYGGVNRPRYGEGGGCSAFAVSFIEAAGLMDEEFLKNWYVEVRAPMASLGGPVFGKRVAASKILGLSRWARENEPHVLLPMWDPTLAYRWIVDTWKRELKNPSGMYLLEKTDRTLAIVVDARHIPPPGEPVWLEGENPYRQHGLRFGPDPYKAAPARD